MRELTVVEALWQVAKTADRWRRRKGHSEGHDCDLCRALAELRLAEMRAR